MSALETQEMTSGIGLSLEPPLSPPVVRSSASPEPNATPDLAMPALRPPETPTEPEPLMAPQPIEPITAAPEPEELPVMAPAAPEAQPEPEPQPMPVIPVNFPPAPAPAPEPEPEPVELPEIAPLTLTPPAPTPAEPPAAETEAPVELLPVIDPFPAAAPVVAPMPSPAAEPALLEQLAHSRGGYRIVVRLNDGQGIDVGEFKDFGTAMEGAQEVIEQFTNASGSWPFYAGRFIRPDLIVSVDVVDA